MMWFWHYCLFDTQLINGFLGTVARLIVATIILIIFCVHCASFNDKMHAGGQCIIHYLTLAISEQMNIKVQTWSYADSSRGCKKLGKN